MIDKKPQAKTCAAIVGITDEGAEIMEEYKGSPAQMPVFSRQPRLSSTMRFPATALCAPGRKSSDSRRPLPSFSKRSMKKRRRTRR